MILSSFFYSAYQSVVKDIWRADISDDSLLPGVDSALDGTELCPTQAGRGGTGTGQVEEDPMTQCVVED